MIMCPWVTYLVADGLQLSGIVAILTNGLFLNIYAAPNITRGSRKVLKIAYETIAYSAETLVFLFMGMGFFSFEHVIDRLTVGAIIVTILILNLSRFFNVALVSFFVNKTRSQLTHINNKKQFVMWIGGLRGAMAYALAMQSIADYGDPGKTILGLTMVYAFFTILGVGSILNPILERCDVMQKSDDASPAQEATQNAS
mmetsp:Transcript_9733/g.16397  ORF Transcript_9733/g.16397 Transcript_9733/m.16397 type:complete len:199 (-) Transcript_9733:405-1001(-)